LYFVDYGDNEYVAKDELYSLRTDMLKLRFQAVECFLAGVAPISSDDSSENHASSWNNHGVERFEELTQVSFNAEEALFGLMMIFVDFRWLDGSVCGLVRARSKRDQRLMSVSTLRLIIGVICEKDLLSLA
jgi:hypothetical protein